MATMMDKRAVVNAEGLCVSHIHLLEMACPIPVENGECRKMPLALKCILHF
jgi:hypothetical protein